MSGQSDPNAGKDNNGLLWAIALIIIIGCVIWWFYSDQLKKAFIFVRRYEAMFVALFTDKLNVLIMNLYSATPADLTYEAAVFLSEEVGHFLMYPSIGLLVLMALYMLKNHSYMRWHTKYSIDTLVKQEQKNWPQISPVVPMDLVDTDVNEGPWAMAMNPMQFARKYKLVTVEKVADRKAAWRSEGMFEATLIKERAYRLFVSQMGPAWQGPDKLPAHTKALYAIFLARIEHEGDDAKSYIDELSIEAARGELHFRRTDEFIKKYGQSRAGTRCAQRHAYVYTLMASLLELARTDGVFASADFLWLKPVDRRLWYILNSVGRQVVPSEVAGPWAHWLAEKEMHRPIVVPMVDEAVVGLEKALANMVYLPTEAEEDASEAPPGLGGANG